MFVHGFRLTKDVMYQSSSKSYKKISRRSAMTREEAIVHSRNFQCQVWLTQPRSSPFVDNLKLSSFWTHIQRDSFHPFTDSFAQLARRHITVTQWERVSASTPISKRFSNVPGVTIANATLTISRSSSRIKRPSITNATDVVAV